MLTASGVAFFDLFYTVATLPSLLIPYFLAILVSNNRRLQLRIFYFNKFD